LAIAGAGLGMDEDSFNICYAGELLEGHTLAEVRNALAVLFNAREETLDKLFSGERHLLRRGCNREEALRYKAAMERAGARARLSRVGGERGATLTLDAPGADVLRPEERRRDDDTAPAIPAFTVAGAGERLGPPEPAPPPAPDVSHLSLSAAGASLAPASRPAPAPVPIPALDLAPPGSAMLEPSRRENDSPPLPATDHLELEP
jgi:hypothetical protein